MRIPEAPESNAGDDFHVLWTIKKSFELLNFNENGLKCITIEGVDAENANKLDPIGDKLLGVDIAEYYGDENFNDAKQVIISQLKYSTRRTHENWTFSKLYTGKKSNSFDGSVFHRLAKVFKTFLDEYGRNIVLKKIMFKLISNRKFNPKQSKFILDVQSFLKEKKTNVSINKLYTEFPLHKEELEKIKSATKLKPTEFIDFLSLLNFDDCGTHSSYYQEIEIVKAIQDLTISNYDIQQDSLFRMVWRKMLPDAIDEGRNKITEIDLLNCFQMSEERLFPVSQNFEVIDNLIIRSQLESIIEEIFKNETGQPICLHGDAGIGKSTISQLIKKNIPKSSEVVLFDCYGEGAYLNPSDGRHLHKEALVQISNDIARKVGSPFLLTPDADSHILIREFKKRVEIAIRILKKRDPNSILILVVDAADNSITAAQKNKTTSFIQDLLNEPFCDGFRLVVTSRTYRVSTLGLPENYINISLKPFNLQETQKHLTLYFPKSTDTEITDFHELTNGIPRVQAYVLDLKKRGIKDVINYLKPNGKTVEDLILSKITYAGNKLGSNGQALINTFFTYLITLPRPVPFTYIELLTDLNEGLIQDFSTDIWHGLVSNNSKFSFRDEDFENYIRQKYIPNEENRKKIADIFLEKANEDEYASINLGTALFEANYKEKLIAVVLQEDYKTLPTDPIRKKEVYIERTKLGMKVCSQIEDRLTFFKLVFIAAEVAKTDLALRNLLISNADLVAEFGDIDILQKLNIQSEEKSWLGSFHYQIAAIYSRKVDSREFAKKHLKTAEKWIEWRNGQKNSSEFYKYQITAEDLANGAEAFLRLEGLHAALDWLNKWSPKATVFKAANCLIDNVLKFTNREQILEWLKSIDLPLYAKLLVIDKIEHFGIPYDLNKITDDLLNTSSQTIYLLPPVISYCELLFRLNSYNSDKIFKIIDKIKIKLPQYAPTFLDNYNSDNDENLLVDIFLKKESLKASLTGNILKLEDLHPERFKVIDENLDYRTRESISNEKNKFDRFYKHAIAIYQFRANIIISKNDKDDNSEFYEICKKIREDYDLRHYDSHWASNKLNFLALKILDAVILLKDGDELIETILESFEHKNQNYLTLRINIALNIAKLERFNIIFFKILDEIDQKVESSSMASTEIVSFYIQISRIALGVDNHVSKYYFEKAINAVSEIDIEAQEQIKCIYNLTQLGIPKENPHLAFEFARFVEHSKSRLEGYDNFPLEEGIKGITHLDCGAAFAIICRWEHKNIAKITSEILPILKISLDKGFINTSVGGSLLSLNEYYWTDFVDFVKELLKRYNNERDWIQKSFFLRTLIREIQINCPPQKKYEVTKAIYNEIENSQYVKKDVVQSIKNYFEFITEIEKNGTINSKKGTTTKFEKHDDHKKTKINKVDFDVSSISILNEELKKIKSDNDSYFIKPEVEDLLNKIKDSCQPANYVSHLNALINISPDLIIYDSFEKALKERLEEWDFYLPVREWKAQNFKNTLMLWYSNFSWDEGIYYEGIREFAKLFSVSDDKLSEIIISILPEKVEELSATSLYHTISFLKTRLSQNENEILISWVLPKWNSNIKSDFADGFWNDSTVLPDNSSEVIAQTLRFILGHPDKRIRWRGVHSLRKLVNFGNTNILKLLIEKQNIRTCIPFQNRKYTFYWLSSKLYLWICIEKLSKENPKEVVKLKDEIIQELFNKDSRHVLISYFIKQTCLNLYEFDKSLFSNEELNFIDNSLKSQFIPVKEKTLQREQRKYSSEDGEWKFKFDWIDTLPYWYSQLGRCFNLSEYDVADLADKYISEKWGYVGEPYNDNHVVVEHYSLTSNNHGSLPVVEKLQTYYEYHAMFCAANDLLEKEPLKELDSLDSWDSWEHWIESEVLTWKQFWLTDFRDPIPLEKKFWFPEFDKFDKKWRDVIEDEQYDSVLGLTSDSEIKIIFPYGRYNRYFGENHESVSIDSALVSTKSSNSLLRALHTANNSHDYHIPLEEHNLEIDNLNFQMFGWLKNIRSESEGLDKHDPFAHNVSKDYIVLGKQVTELFDISYQNNSKEAYYNGKVVSLFQNWSDVTEQQSYNKLENEGSRLQVDLIFLLEFLKKRDMSLIIKCEIIRQLKERDYDYINNNRNTKLYLIHQNGNINTLRGRDYKVG
ncbi:MAG: ATP-binding protein [Flavobacterium sp.]